jgi:hypothetical protein
VRCRSNPKLALQGEIRSDCSKKKPSDEPG